MKLVLIDDEEQILKALKNEIQLIFSEDDLTISCHTDPGKALDEIRGDHNDIFLTMTDLRMPSQNGTAVLEEIADIDPDIQTILITGYSDLPDIQKAVAASIQGLIFKPWSQNELFTAITKAKKQWYALKEYEKIKREWDIQIRMASQFQQTLFPDARYELAPAIINLLYQPLEAYGNGGDFYELQREPDGSFCLLYGDASGHGIRAAYISIAVKTITTMMKREGPGQFKDPAALLDAINSALTAVIGTENSDFFALAALSYNPETKELQFCGAGQPPLFLLRNKRISRLSSAGNLVLGVTEENHFQSQRIAVAPGDRLVITSDGIFEAMSECYCEAFRSFEEMIIGTGEIEGQELLNRFREKYAPSCFSDDITLGIIDFKTDKS